MKKYYNQEAIIADYKNGMTYKQLKDKYGCAKSTTYRIFNLNNVQLKNQIKKKESTLLKTETMIEQYNNGLQLKDIASNHNVSTSYVNELLKRNKIARNRKRKISSNNTIIKD